jgi:O-antigen/teichoic acid export membrane protein
MAADPLTQPFEGVRMRGVIWSTAQVFGARLAAQAAGFATAVLIARALGPQGFGVYSFMLIAATLMAQVPGAGLDMSAVRVSARHRERDPERARQVLLVAGIGKTLLGLALALLGVLVAGWLAGGELGPPESAAALRFAAAASLALALTEFTIAALQAYERFGAMLAVSALTAALRFAPVALLWAAGALRLQAAMAAFLAAAYVGHYVRAARSSARSSRSRAGSSSRRCSARSRATWMSWPSATWPAPRPPACTPPRARSPCRWPSPAAR